MKRIVVYLAIAAVVLPATGCGCFRRGISHTAAMPVTTGCSMCTDDCSCGQCGMGGPMTFEGPVFSSPGIPIVEEMPTPAG